jgi:hypothetical protein
MSKEKCEKKRKSFHLKKSNAEKIEKIAYDEKRKQSEVVDKLVEDAE